MVRIEFRPENLSFERFQSLDEECFADEPVDRETFGHFLTRDFWAAFEEDVLVGYCSVHRKPGFAWLRRIGVTKEYRGRGIGRNLMNAAIEHCRQVGLAEVILYVQSDNLPAMRLYETSGFRSAEVTYQYIFPLSKLSESGGQLPKADLQAVTIDKLPQANLPMFPRQWADIRTMHEPPRQYVLVFQDHLGQSVGYCRLTPSFPGCFPFALQEPNDMLFSSIAALKSYLLPEKEILKLTLNDEVIAKACDSNAIPLNYKLFKMVRSRLEV